MKTNSVRLRAATVDDAAFLRELRNDVEVRLRSRTSSSVGEDAHSSWLGNTLADPRRHLLVVEDRDAPVGQLRLDVDGKRAEVSIAVIAAARGRGIAAAALRAADTQARALGLSELQAFVQLSNEASLRLFERAGYARVGEADDLVELRHSIG